MNSEALLQAARRVAAADLGCRRSIELYPCTGENDSEDGRLHWSNALREKEAAIAALIEMVDCNHVPCTACGGTGRISVPPQGNAPEGQ